MNPGQGTTQNKNKLKARRENKRNSTKIVQSDNGKVNVYRNLFPKGKDLHHLTREAGYQDDIKDLPEGDTVDLNTNNYRYIGYFTLIRKAIQLAWIYPKAAIRKGHEGTVRLRFNIMKSGEVRKLKVLESSGHRSLDQAIIKAIRLSSPYAPLPKGFNKPRLVVTANFRYTLN